MKPFIKLLFVVIFLGSCFSCKSQSKQKITKEEKNITKKDIELDYLDKNYVLGKFEYLNNNDFVKVPKKFSTKLVYVRKEVLTAFLKMQSEAKKVGLFFKVISGTRNFAYQKRIWDYKWHQKFKKLPPLQRVMKILEFSSMPSTSRHHWGTDIDINNLNNSYFEKGKGKKEYDWLLKNAHKYGFYQVYTSKEKGRTGYSEEKWHWSYLPLSKIYLEYYNKYITNKDISGFKGAEFASKIDMLTNYVNGVNNEIK